ncbi:MAG: hypothetical protein SPE21_04515 [Candidatus Cryptobacteroides sp.]|nr:hypothetical protein [Candidatus Cryptobacteroides sp.]
MKKYILFVVAAAAMVACNKSEVPSIDGGKNEADQKYVIYAEDVNTRTVTDASFNVKWADGDNLAVYTWPVETALPTDDKWQAENPVNYVAVSGEQSPRPFALSNEPIEYAPSTDTYPTRLDAFKTRFGAGASNLKWGVIYPGRMSSASKSGMGIVVFGDPNIVRCRQTGNDNMDHLAYQDVLWGTATGPNPQVEMKHLGTMMVYTVKNNTGSDFTVKSIKIGAPVAIGGQLRFNVFDGTFPADDNVKFMTTKNDCTLWVQNGAAIPADGSAMFYQVLAPFTLEKDKKVTMTVETEKGTWTKEMTANTEVVFESGKRNTASLNVDGFKGDVTLVSHETGKINFAGDSKLSRYLNLNTAELMTWTNDFNRDSEVDAIVARNGDYTKFAIAAPSYESATAFDASIANWTTQNKTIFKKVTKEVFDTVTKLSDLKTAYDAATGETDRIDLAVEDVIIAKTAKGNYALIKMTSGTKNTEGHWTDWSFSLKTVL